MATKRGYATRALKEVHEGAKDLFKAGAISAQRMAEFDSLCLSPTEYSPSEIKTLRKRTGKTQAELARHMGISLSTLRQWEIGAKKPSSPSLKLLDILDRKGLEGIL